MNRVVEFLKYINWCYGGIKNKDRRQQMMKFETNDCLTIEHHGELYPNQLIYMIEVESEYSGWFSIMNDIVSALTVANNYGLMPVIDMGYSTFYSEPSMMAEGIPLYEYYFCQPLGIQLTEVRKCHNVIYMTNPQRSFVNHMFEKNEQYIQESREVQQLAAAIARFIHLNAASEAYISKGIKAILGGTRALGVHVRGTDFKAGFNNHAIHVTVEEYVEHVQRAMKQHQYDRIFLATDEEQTIQRFRKIFGEKVVYHDVYRAKGDTKVGIHCSKCNRELHHYKLGLEVLLDMYSLAACDALIACPSGVSFHALLNKRAKGEKYEYMDIIDKGRYKNKQISNIEIKRMYLS